MVEAGGDAMLDITTDVMNLTIKEQIPDKTGTTRQ